jgi:hypothetical protein
MTAGDAADWDDLFVGQLIPSVLALVLDAWDRIEKPAADEHEDHTSLRLYAAMIRGKDRQRHFFLIRLQDVEVDTDLVKVSGREDIVFFPPANDEDVYFCLEAKRLNALVSGVRRSLADEYVKEGMQRFVDRKYSRRICHGGMLGYVLDGDLDRAIKNVANVVRLYHEILGMESPGEIRESSVRPGDRHARETHHQRHNDVVLFRLHHLFVAGLQP